MPEAIFLYNPEAVGVEESAVGFGRKRFGLDDGAQQTG